MEPFAFTVGKYSYVGKFLDVGYLRKCLTRKILQYNVVERKSRRPQVLCDMFLSVFVFIFVIK